MSVCQKEMKSICFCCCPNFQMFIGVRRRGRIDPHDFPLALRSGSVCVHLHSINTLMLLHVAVCETVLLIPAMSQAVPPSEAYGEKVTSCFILISIITL